MNEPNDDPLFPEDALRHHLLAPDDSRPDEAWVAAVAARAANARLRKSRRLTLLAGLLGLLFVTLCGVLGLLLVTQLATWLHILAELADTLVRGSAKFAESAAATLRPKALHLLPFVPLVLPALLLLETTAYAALRHFHRPIKSS